MSKCAKWADSGHLLSKVSKFDPGVWMDKPSGKMKTLAFSSQGKAKCFFSTKPNIPLPKHMKTTHKYFFRERDRTKINSPSSIFPNSTQGKWNKKIRRFRKLLNNCLRPAVEVDEEGNEVEDRRPDDHQVGAALLLWKITELLRHIL